MRAVMSMIVRVVMRAVMSMIVHHPAILFVAQASSLVGERDLAQQ
jgi:hypothetical protein